MLDILGLNQRRKEYKDVNFVTDTSEKADYFYEAMAKFNTPSLSTMITIYLLSCSLLAVTLTPNCTSLLTLLNLPHSTLLPTSSTEEKMEVLLTIFSNNLLHVSIRSIHMNYLPVR